MKRLCLAALSSALLMTGCATTELDPAKVCTAEWIKPRAENALSHIQNDAESVFKNLRKVAASYVAGNTPGPLQLWSLQNSVKSLEKELKTGRGMTDLKTMAKTCDNPKIITDAMGGFLRDQELPDGMVNFIERFPLYQQILTDAVRESQTTS